MDNTTSVKSRTKETLVMDDQSSVTSNIKSLASIDGNVKVEMSVSTPINSSHFTETHDDEFEEWKPESLSSNVTQKTQYETSNVLDYATSSVDLKASSSKEIRGRSKSPRPVISAETRARWAMLKSLAGISKGNDETGDGGIVGAYKEERPSEVEQSDEADRAQNGSAKSSDPRLRPLHLGEDVGHDVSIERYLQQLEQNPHIDHHRGFHEGLELARTLSARSRSRHQDRTMQRDIGLGSTTLSHSNDIDEGSHSRKAYTILHKSSDEAQGRPRNKSLTTHNGNFNPMRKQTPREKFDTTSHDTEGISKAIEHDLGKSAIIAANSVQGHVRSDYHASAEVLGKGEADLVKDLQVKTQGMGASLTDTVKSLKEILPSVHPNPDLQRAKIELRAGGEVVGQEVMNARKTGEGAFPAVCIIHAIEKGEHELYNDLRTLGDKGLAHDLVRINNDSQAGSDIAEKTLGHLLPDIHVGEEIRAQKQILVGDVEKGINFAEKELQSHEGHDLKSELAKTSHRVEPGMADYETLTMSDKSKQKMIADKEIAAAGRRMEREASIMARSMHDGLQKVDDAVDLGSRAAQIDKLPVQNHERGDSYAPGQTSPKARSKGRIDDVMATHSRANIQQLAASHAPILPSSHEKPPSRPEANDGRQVEGVLDPLQIPNSPLNLAYSQNHMPIGRTTPARPIQISPIKHQQPGYTSQTRARETFRGNTQSRSLDARDSRSSGLSRQAAGTSAQFYDGPSTSQAFAHPPMSTQRTQQSENGPTSTETLASQGVPKPKKEDPVCQHEGHPANECPHQNRSPSDKQQQLKAASTIQKPLVLNDHSESQRYSAAKSEQSDRDRQEISLTDQPFHQNSNSARQRQPAHLYRKPGNPGVQWPPSNQIDPQENLSQCKTYKPDGHPPSQRQIHQARVVSKRQQTSVPRHEGQHARESPPKDDQAQAHFDTRVDISQTDGRQVNSNEALPQQSRENGTIVSGPQYMLNVMKATTEASIEASGGYPGFKDRRLLFPVNLQRFTDPKVISRDDASTA